jgi:hypothetical protein
VSVPGGQSELAAESTGAKHVKSTFQAAFQAASQPKTKNNLCYQKHTFTLGEFVYNVAGGMQKSIATWALCA